MTEKEENFTLKSKCCLQKLFDEIEHRDTLELFPLQFGEKELQKQFYESQMPGKHMRKLVWSFIMISCIVCTTIEMFSEEYSSSTIGQLGILFFTMPVILL